MLAGSFGGERKTVIKRRDSASLVLVGQVAVDVGRDLVSNRTTLNRVSWCLHGSLHILSLISLLIVLHFRIYSILRTFTFLDSLFRIGYRLQVFWGK